MRMRTFLCFFCCLVFLSSCTKQEYNTSIQGFRQLEKDLKEKFGENAHYTDLTILQNTNKGLDINLLVTENPYSYKMDGWNYKNGDWQKITEVYLELNQGDITNYLYTLKQEVNIMKIAYIANLSIQRTEEKGLVNVSLNQIEVLSPNNGDKSKMGYMISLISKDKAVKYHYNLKGDLIEENVL